MNAVRWILRNPDLPPRIGNTMRWAASQRTGCGWIWANTTYCITLVLQVNRDFIVELLPTLYSANIRRYNDPDPARIQQAEEDYLNILRTE